MKPILTSAIKDRKNIKVLKFWDYIPALLANLFSIIFATSIIIELQDVVNGWVLALLSVFIVLFLIMNEVIKVKEIRKVFSGNRNALLPFSITFIISLTLATIGMYFFTNKSSEIKDLSELNKSTELNAVTLKYQDQYNKILNSEYENTKDYESFNNELKYWKRANAANLAERSDLRAKVNEIQNLIVGNKRLFNTNKQKQLDKLNLIIENEKSVINAKFNQKMNSTRKNDFITYIFLSLIFVTEFATIILNKNIAERHNILDQYVNSNLAKKYLIASNLLTSLYLSSKNNWVNINTAKYSPVVNDSFQWEEICALYNMYIMLGILSDGELRTNENNPEKKILWNEFQMNENEAQKKIDEYYEKFFSIV